MSKLHIIRALKSILIVCNFNYSRNNFSAVGLILIIAGLWVYELKMQNELNRKSIVFVLLLCISVFTLYYLKYN